MPSSVAGRNVKKLALLVVMVLLRHGEARRERSNPIGAEEHAARKQARRQVNVMARIAKLIQGLAAQ